MNHRTNFVLSAGMTVAILALAAGSASAAGHSKMAMRENVGTRVQGISVKPRPTIDPTKIVGFKLQPRPSVQGIMIPPKGLKPTGLKPPVIGVIVTPPVIGVIVKPPKVVGVWIPPVIVNPPAVVSLPGETTYVGRRYSWYTGGARATTNTAVSTAQAPCNCLTKEYLQDGSVLFKDLCTKEAAVLTVEEMKAKM